MNTPAFDPAAPATRQAAFATALLDPAHPGPPGLRAWNGSDPQARLAVYRNNVVSSLLDALADSFPVVQQLVGREFFRALGAVFVRAQPPRSPILAAWGEGFADWLDGFEPARCLPYLADVARLEWLRLRAMHAPDAPPLAPAEAAAALTDPQDLAAARMHWHPSAALLRARHAAVSLWAAHQVDDAEVDAAVAAIPDPLAPQAALVLRPALHVLVLPLDAAAAAFVAASLSARAPLGAALSAALEADPDLDLGRLLLPLVQHGALVGVERPSPAQDGPPTPQEQSA